MRPRLLTVVAIGLAVIPLEARQQPLEYDVKAAFLLNFSRYVQWPPARVAVPFQLCVIGADPFGPRLEATVDGESWHGAPIVVRRVHEIRQARDCHLLFVPGALTDRFRRDAAALSGAPVLTVGETAPFLTAGGMIQLFVEHDKVRFAINQRAAEGQGLQISSRLLRLARFIVQPPTNP